MAPQAVTFSDVIRRNAARSPDGIAFVFDAQRISHGEYVGRVEKLSAGLSSLGVAAGDRIAIVSQNCPEFVDLIGAAAWLGAILVPVNWRLSLDEIAHVVCDADPKVIFADASGQELFGVERAEFLQIDHWIGIDAAKGRFAPLSDYFAEDVEPPAPHQEPGAFVMIHTAAVGGYPKGAVLSQASLLANATQAGACWDLSEADVSYAPLPLFHVAGLNLLLACSSAGAANVIRSKFDANEGSRLIEKERITVFLEFAPMLSSLLDAAGGSGQLASLRVVSGLDSTETMVRFEAACPKANFFVVFGQTETSGFVTMARHRDRPGSAGKPMALCRVSVVDDRDTPVPAGQIGEIVVQGPVVFDGYWNRPNETATTLRNEWLHTGDNGSFDADGYLFYKGRTAAKELIKPGGENVYPAEVEAVLEVHPAIVDAVVFGVPDKEWGEAVKAVCALKADAETSPEEVRSFLTERIARYKRPKHLVFVKTLPRTSDGAIDRMKVKKDHS